MLCKITDCTLHEISAIFWLEGLYVSQLWQEHSLTKSFESRVLLNISVLSLQEYIHFLNVPGCHLFK